MQGEEQRNFERARNTIELDALGDSERWGSVADVALTLSTRDEVSIATEQIVRVQCPDLLARSWDLIVDWSFDDTFQVGDNINRLGLEITIGVGQASRRVVLDLLAALSGYPSPIGPPAGYGQMPPIPWEAITLPFGSGYRAGTVQLSWPIPASSLAARAVLAVQHTAFDYFEPYLISGSVFVAVAPRALK